MTSLRRHSRSARSEGVARRQVTNAALAASTALSTSSSRPRAISAQGSAVTGS
jgi:hypothetical protein